MSRWPLYEAAWRALPYISALGVDIGTFLEEDLDDIEVAFCRSGLEGIAVLSALGIDIGTLLEEDLDDVEVAFHPKRPGGHCRSVRPWALISAPFSRRIWTMSRWPPFEAAWRALP